MDEAKLQIADELYKKYFKPELNKRYDALVKGLRHEKPLLTDLAHTMIVKSIGPALEYAKGLSSIQIEDYRNLMMRLYEEKRGPENEFEEESLKMILKESLLFELELGIYKIPGLVVSKKENKTGCLSVIILLVSVTFLF